MLLPNFKDEEIETQEIWVTFSETMAMADVRLYPPLKAPPRSQKNSSAP